MNYYKITNSDSEITHLVKLNSLYMTLERLCKYTTSRNTSYLMISKTTFYRLKKQLGHEIIKSYCETAYTE